MPRQARLVYPNVALHIVQRGHDRRDCFRQETDYLVYLATLRDLLTKTGCALHAYCLMTNHVHLFLTPSRADACARLMRSLGQRYVQYFNRRYQRSGTLWEGRFFSCLVDSAHYVLGTYRYVERNPVKARMVASPSAYAWSSSAGNAGLAENRLLTPHAEYLALADEPGKRHAAYARMVAMDDDPAFLATIRDATQGGFALVGEALRAKLPAEALPRLERKAPGPKPLAPPGQLDMLDELGLRPRSS
jgi:putative transposase